MNGIKGETRVTDYIEMTKELRKEAVGNILKAYERGYIEGKKDGAEEVLKKLDLEGSLKKSYNEGMEKAWLFAREIGEWSNKHIQEVFGDDESITQYDILKKLSVDQAFNKVEAWNKAYFLEKPVEQFQVGDEVYTDAGDWGVVTSIGYCTDDKAPVVIARSGKQYGYFEGARWHKTGKNYPEITEVLNKLSERG